MKLLHILIVATACILSVNTLAADNPRLYPRNLDVDKRTYAVACPNGEMASLTVRYNIKDEDLKPVNEDVRKARISVKPTIPDIAEVCIYPISDRDKICQPKMNLQDAANEACK